MEKDGNYRCRSEDGYVWDRYDFIINLRETNKNFVITLLENKDKYLPTRFEMMFKKSNKVTTKKEHGIHGFIWGDNYFVMYPYRDGLPYCFEKYD